MPHKINSLLKIIKTEKPLILNITNAVTMDFVANGLLSVGASPVMSASEDELEDLIHLARIVVINIGTLDEKFISLCKLACKIANQLNKPIILDPVGAGATQSRTMTSLTMLANYDIAIVRGNASEIMALDDSGFNTKGVDSSVTSACGLISAKHISHRYAVTVVISGESDFIIQGDKVETFSRGSSYMPMITGTGCLMTAVIGAFHAVETDRFIASSAAALFYAICGEKAAAQANGPASFKVGFLDALCAIHEDAYA